MKKKKYAHILYHLFIEFYGFYLANFKMTFTIKVFNDKAFQAFFIVLKKKIFLYFFGTLK